MNYSIVFSGRIRAGVTPQEARQNFAELYKVQNPALLDRVFSGQNVILKKGLSEDEARQQEMMLLMAGLSCEVRNNAPPAAPPPPPPLLTAAAPAEPPQPAPYVPPSRPASAGATLATMQAPPLALAENPAPAAPLPAALRRGPGQSPVQEGETPPADADTQVTHHGRPGEALLEERFAPWDPAFMPDTARGLSWGGFFAPLLWGSFNGMRLSFVPALGVRLFRHYVPAWGWMVFYFAFGAFYLVKGRELAWENKTWRNADHFLRVQRYWAIGGFAFMLLAVSGMVHLMSQERQAAQEQVTAQLAEVAFAKMGDPAASAEDKARAREDYLKSIQDPRRREAARLDLEAADRERAEQQAEAQGEASGQPEDSQPSPD